MARNPKTPRTPAAVQAAAPSAPAVTYAPRRPRPLLRTSITLTPPNDDDSVTLELVALFDHGHELGLLDHPELLDGGWIEHSIGRLSVFTRLIP